MNSSSSEKILLRGKENYEVWKFQFDICTKGTKQDAKMRYIVQSVTESVLRKLTTCKTLSEMISKLDSLYGVDLTINKLHLQNKFYSMQCGNDVMSFVEEIDNIVDKLTEAGEKLSNEMITAKILNSLPKSYESFITAFQCTSDMTFETLRTKLISETERRNLNNKEKSEIPKETEKVLVSKKFQLVCNYCKNNGHTLKECDILKRKNASIKCYKCGKIGHIARLCMDTNKFVETDHQTAESKVNLAATVWQVDNMALNAKTSDKCLDNTKEWIVDSGATQHMVFNKDILINYESVDDKLVIMPNGDSLKVSGIGEVKLNNAHVNLTLLKVLHISELKFNLMATKPFTDIGVKLVFQNNQVMFVYNEKVVMTAVYRDGLYFIEPIMDCSMHAEDSIYVNNLSLYEWHVRLGHQNLSYVKDILKTNNIEFKNLSFECDNCKYGKMTRKPFEESKSRRSQVGELIHMDVGGPIEVESLGKNKYYLLLRDDFSNWRTIYFMKHKSEVKENLKLYLEWFVNQTGHNIKTLRTDNGLEEVNKDIENLLLESGVAHEKTCPYTPEQNGRIERDNRTIIESARTMLISSKLGKSFWAEATNTAVFVLNRTGRTSVHGKTPIELFFGRKPDLNFLKPYGCEVFVHIPKLKRKKFDPKARKGFFVGYDDEVKGYKIFFPSTKTLEMHRDVDFSVKRENCLLQIKGEKVNSTELENIFNGPDGTKWKIAVDAELNAMFENKVWEIVPEPNKQIIDSKWIFKIKNSGQYKARLVARGCFQRDINECELYSPVAKIDTVRILLSLAVKKNLIVHQMDVDTAFLNGALKEPVYMRAPPGLKIGSGQVLKLKKSIYGLRQAPKCWYDCFSTELGNLGFNRSKCDECLLVKDNLYLI